ncbi:MAG: SUMF1/EgtB/PvdO family nonheme iron enzyme, partial [bacterium]|nr:SUMF1/EgtB/PvdO family nonheme iron enzyme [bacterium]
MTDAADPHRELEQAKAALAALSDEQVELLLAARKGKRDLQARMHGDGAIAQGDQTAATGPGGVAVAGDVHGDVVTTPRSAADPGIDDLRNAYLNRVVEQTGHLSLSGVDRAVAAGPDAETRLHLNAVYTALVTLASREQDLPRHSERPVPGEKERPLSALEQLNRHQRLVLLGDPGSGKSTFVNFVALCLAGEALGLPEAGLGQLTAPLPGDGGDDQQEHQPWEHGKLVPVRVVLRDFAARGLPPPGERAAAQDLWNFIAGELAEASLGDYASGLRKELLERGGLILLDGLDEVPEAEKRREQIKQAVEDFVQSFGRCRVLLTSRIYAYQNQDWRLPDFAEAVLAPFSDGQIRRFVARWYDHCAALGRFRGEDAAGRAAMLQRAIFASDRLCFLARRPLLLTLMASLHAWRGGSLPERRERLYADTVELLLDFWERQRIVRDARGEPVLIQPSLAEWLEVDREKVRKVLETLAFEAHGAQPGLEGTADLPEGEVVAHLMRLRDDQKRNPANLIDYLSQRAGLLEPRGVGVYTFPHRTFQEYLAACHLTGESYPEEIANLAREEPERWREVALLAAAKAAVGSTAGVWHLADALCFRDPDDPQSGTADAWGAHLAAQALVESADLAQISERNRSKIERLRRWLVRLLGNEQLPAVERTLAGTNLAHLDDPRFDADAWYLPRTPTLGWVEVPAGSFLMGSDPQQYKWAIEERESPQHSLELPTCYMARYPVTVQQFAEFVASASYRPDDTRCLDGVSNHPVVLVSWYDAMAYCRWLGEKLRGIAQERLNKKIAESDPWQEAMWKRLAGGELIVTLPSEAEWEKAARGSDGRIYPWGNDEDPGRANYDETGISGTSSAGCFPGGVSPYGCEEMSGNILEWTRSLWGDDFSKSSFHYPYDSCDGREDMEASEKYLRVLRGGSFLFIRRVARCAFRYWFGPRGRRGDGGFRVVLSPF